MHARHLFAATATAAVSGPFGFVAPAAAHVGASRPAADIMAADVFAMSAGRFGAALAGLFGLAGLIIGSLALFRPAGRVGNGRLGAFTALLAGAVAMALGGLVVATSDSGIGTGNGRGGAYLALAVGAAAIVLGGLALARSRRTGRLTA